MQDNWYFHDGHKQVGPFNLDVFKAMRAQGTISASQMVWCQGMSEWQPAGAIPALAVATPVPPPMQQHFGVASVSAQGRFGTIGTRALALWNPGAAASWSLLFGAPFGSFLHARNWTALGDPVKARNAMIWFWVTALAYIFACFSANPVAPAGVGLWSLILWYFISGRPQVKVVNGLGPNSYEKKSWIAPLLTAFAVMFVLFIVFIVIFVAAAAVGAGRQA